MFVWLLVTGQLPGGCHKGKSLPANIRNITAWRATEGCFRHANDYAGRPARLPQGGAGIRGRRKRHCARPKRCKVNSMPRGAERGACQPAGCQRVGRMGNQASNKPAIETNLCNMNPIPPPVFGIPLCGVDRYLPSYLHNHQTEHHQTTISGLRNRFSPFLKHNLR